MINISEKALFILKSKLDLDYKEEEVIRNNFFDKPIEAKKEQIEAEKSILKDILSNFIKINQSFDNVIKLLTSDQEAIPLPEEPTVDAININDDAEGDTKRKKKGGGLLGAVGLALFAFSPAILDYLKELGDDPEKIKETLKKAFDWFTNDLPKFFKNDLAPIVSNFLDKEVIGSITGMDILKSAGLATILYAGKGVILNLLTKALFSTTGWFLKSLLGFLVSPLGLAALAATGFAALLMKGVSAIGEYGDKKREEEAKEKWDAERAAEAAPYVEANNITKEVMDAAPEDIRQKGSSVRGIIAGKVQKILKSKDAETFKSLSPDKKWKMVEGTLTVDEKRSLIGKEKTAADVAAESKSGTDLLDAKVAQMFPDATMVTQDDYKTKLLGTTEQRKAAREALGKEGVKAEADPVIKSAGETELEAKPMPTRNPNAIPIDTSNTVDSSTGAGSQLSFMQSDGEKLAPATTNQPAAVAEPASQTPQTYDQKIEAEEAAFDARMEQKNSGPNVTKVESGTLPLSNWVEQQKANMMGEQIGNASVEAQAPKPPRPIIINAPTQQRNQRPMIKPGDSWNINDVPDPSPTLGNIMSQLFVSDTNFSGAIAR